MPTRDLGEVLKVVEAGIEQFSRGRNWVARRDAADVLGVSVREIILALRQGASDADPDVAHVSKHLTETILKDFSANPSSVQIEISSQRRVFENLRAAIKTSDSDQKEEPNTQQAIREWLSAFADRANAKLESEGDRLAVLLPLQGGRSQKIFIQFGQKDSAGSEVVVIYSRCGQTEAKLLTSALESNARLSHAAFAVLRDGAESQLILITRRRLDEMSRAGFEADIAYIARKGDQAEAQLRQNDQF